MAMYFEQQLHLSGGNKIKIENMFSNDQTIYVSLKKLRLCCSNDILLVCKLMFLYCSVLPILCFLLLSSIRLISF